MAQSNWEADKMLDVYIHDYLLKRNLQATAKAFKEEGKVATDPVAIDAPGGFLFEWWSVFWDIFIARTNEKHSQVAAAYIETQRAKAKEEHQRQLQMQQLQIMQQQQAQLQRRGVNHPALNGTINATNNIGISGPPTASLLAAKMYEERMKQPQSMDAEISPQYLDANRVALLKSANSHPGQFMQSNHVSGSAAAMQHIQGQNQQTPLQDIKGEMGSSQRSLHMDPSSLYSQGIIQAKSGLSGAGMSQGVSGLPLKGWPLAGIDQLRQNFGPQVNKPFLPQSQFQLLSPNHQQQILAQAQAQSNIDSSNYGMDPRRLRALPRSGLSGKDGQLNGNDASIGSPGQSSSPKVRQDQSFMKATQMQQSSNQQTQELVQQQQNTRKRKPTSSGAANSTGTGNTVAPSVNSPPSTPSIHTPGDGISMASSLQNTSTMSKSLMMYGTDRTGGLASSSNQMDDLDHFGDVGSLDDNVESFLSNDDGDGRDIFAALKSTAEHNVESLSGFTFNEVGCMCTSNSKVVSCHFSSDGKLLASAGHDKRVVLWNMETLQTVSSSQEHSHIITDVCFRPNSSQLATSSFDKTVRLWNAAESIHCLNTFAGHSSQVASLDFHPKELDILCSCDDNGEIRYWSASQNMCKLVSKGASIQVRFQPRSGQFLAAVADNVVSIFDVETNTKIRTLQGHNKIKSICWDANGNTLASVSQDLVKVWSLQSWDCIHELSSKGNQFNSCVFHPRCPQILVIGGYQSVELWNMIEKQTLTVQAHDGLVAALAQSNLTGMIASASHDKSVKIWK
ncbi:transcriptional corepressor [Canna indica]|uniref:Transcriptional corepressor n=1 Tax=Canna indica TaxID=4628 RepID=A0AAQ3QCF5_9LILI|nr:transcriptional corepressor [Canna indica]